MASMMGCSGLKEALYFMMGHDLRSSTTISGLGFIMEERAALTVALLIRYCWNFRMFTHPRLVIFLLALRLI